MGVQYHNNAGNHTVAVIKGEESYEALESFKPILDDINNLVQNNKIEKAGKSYSLEFFLGGDYKVYTIQTGCTSTMTYYNNNIIKYIQYLLMILGLSTAISNYSCVWCHIHKDKR